MDLPSPTKKVYAPATIPAFDPTSARGSFALAAQTAESVRSAIIQNNAKVRRAADFPAQTRSFPARSLEKTQSLPSNHPSFNTGSNQSNFFGRRDNELFAVEESFHLNRDSSRGSSSGVFSSGQGSGFLSGGGAGTRESTMDGFDMDEVFGPGSINSSQLDSQETVVPSQGTRAKRGHSRVEEEEGGGNEDSEMMEDEETGWNATVLPARKELQDDEIDDELAHLAQLSLQEISSETDGAQLDLLPHAESSFADLLATLPPLISYTPVAIPLTRTGSASITTPSTRSSPSTKYLLRRDLFDARFQVLAQESDDNPFIDRAEEIEEDSAPTYAEKGKGRETFLVDEATDLVKGVYEGGLKTWECSIDLVDHLDSIGYSSGDQLDVELIRGKSVLELGCGTALPTCAVFQRLLEEISRNPTDPTSSVRPKLSRIHLQDYNNPVLSLITLPNLMLAYAQHLTTLPPSLPTPSPIPQSLSAINEDVEDAQLNPSNDEPEPGELEITPEFLESFESFLSLENIEIRFFHGSWEGMEIVEGSGAATYDLILSSETIYSLSSLTSLLNLLRSACHSSLDDRGEMAMETRERSLCLIACKRIYFGVGGGEVEFTRRVEAMGGSVESVWGEGVGVGKSLGVGRVVMSVDWKK